jgi:putative flippase GtrA
MTISPIDSQPFAGQEATPPWLQVVRYVLVGGWNTIFGYTCFFFMTRWLTSFMPTYSYIVASLGSNLVSITVAFFAYKRYVFKTSGNYLHEWLRCLIVYSGTIVLSAVAIAPLVGVIRHVSRFYTQAPYIAGAVVMVLGAVSSFLGHKHISFRRVEDIGPGERA